MRLHFSLPFIAIAAMVVRVSGGCTIVEDTNIHLAPDMILTSDYMFSVNQDVLAVPGNPTSIWFSVDPGPVNTARFTYDNMNLDEGSDWYVASLDQEFTSQSIAAGVQSFWGGEHNGMLVLGGTFDVNLFVGSPFYLGVNTGVGFNPNGPNRDIFGWVKLSVDSNFNVDLWDNAMAYQCGGIVIGRNVVPEPSVTVLILGGFVICLAIIRTRVLDTGK